MRHSPFALTVLLAACVAEDVSAPVVRSVPRTSHRPRSIAPAWQLIDYGTAWVSLTASHQVGWPSINDHGRVAGNHVVNQFYVKAFTLKAGILQYLPPRVAGEIAGANRINACGRIAGFSGTHAVLWRPVMGTPPVPVCD